MDLPAGPGAAGIERRVIDAEREVDVLEPEPAQPARRSAAFPVVLIEVTAPELILEATREGYLFVWDTPGRTVDVKAGTWHQNPAHSGRFDP